GESQRYFAVASERKALWSIGIESPRSLPLGHLAEITKEGLTLRQVKVLTPQEIRQIDEEEAVKGLGELLLRAVDIRTRGLDRVALGFSGGLDSSLLAYLTDACGAEVDLISVGVEGSRDIEEAVEGAESLGLPYSVEVYGEEEVEEALDEAMFCVEEPDPVKVGVAIPLLWVAARAAELGDRVLLLGQGCDELFGGYRRYLSEYLKEGADAAHRLMFRDVAGAYERNYERDNKVSAFHGVELRLPFADWELTQFALSLPPELKLPKESHLPRKRILRALAERLGLPPALIGRGKRAIQYSTGVDKALRKIAKRHGLKLGDFLQRRFKDFLARYSRFSSD
ncbi:MAG: asparagine synthase C-terminal domain-containing protein, partial [Candidatus Bathyarchaeia archaeon]